MAATMLTVDQATDLRAKATQVLADNDLGECTKPSPTLYPHQWLWDSCFIAIGLRHLDPERACREILSLFRGQWTNGMLPHVIFSTTDAYHAGPNRWRCDLVTATAGGVETTGITQPPMVAEAVVQVGEALSPARRDEFYREAFPGLVRYHNWLYRERDPDDTGLVTLVHSWESGMDNTPVWMAVSRRAAPISVRVLRKISGDSALDMLRRDNKEVPSEERLSVTDLFTLYYFVDELRGARYDFHRVRDTTRVPLVQDLTFNSILVRANEHLVTIAEAIDARIPAGLRRSMKRTVAAFDTFAHNGEYFSRDARTGELIKLRTVSEFLPLYAGTVSAEQAAALAEKLTEPRNWPRYGIASVPVDAPGFHPRCYWQGPAWVNMNWLIADGLDRYGHADLATRIRQMTIEMVAHEDDGMYEYYSPLDGTGVGSNHFAWTAALVIDMLEREG
jgi:glycogen debranching enzyme